MPCPCRSGCAVGFPTHRAAAVQAIVNGVGAVGAAGRETRCATLGEVPQP